MAGVSAAKVPRVVAAALATAATSVGVTDRLRAMVSPIVYYAANPALLPSAASSSSLAISPSVPSFRLGSCCLRSSSSSPPADSWTCSSLPLARDSSNFKPLRSSLYSTLRLVSQLSPLGCSVGGDLSSSAPTSISPAKGRHCLSSAVVPRPSSVRPSYLSSSFELPWDDELHRQFTVPNIKSMVPSSFTEFMHSSRVKASLSSPNSPSFFTSNLVTLRPSFLAVVTAPSSGLHPLVAVSSKFLHRWHTPGPLSLKSEEEDGKLPGTKPVLTVVLLGWLGSQQKHLKKYAEWYTARGINAVTFTLPMADILSISMGGGKVEEHVERLTTQLSTWLESSKGDKCAERQLIFHTFSNTGWLTYGVVLEKLSARGNGWVDSIKGCVVDSAPAADPDAQVWASGFSAALLKRRNVPSNGTGPHKVVVDTSKPHVAESALHALLEMFFYVFLQIPAVSRRLNQVVTVLSKEQPPCPQLYVYSTADEVIPVNMVELFMEKQRQQGRIVRGCNFQSSPHVDHFRSYPEIYSSQVSNFLQECLEVSPPK